MGNYTKLRPDRRGKPSDRRARKEYLLHPKAGFGGDGQLVKCKWCNRLLDYFLLTVDRYPKCGHLGGTYRRDNIVPACAKCNSGRCKNGNSALCTLKPGQRKR